MKQTMMKWTVVLLAALMVAGCARQKDPATKAVAMIESNVAALRADAQEHAPAELQEVEAGLASLKDQLAKEDYQGVVAAAPGVSAQVSSLQATVRERADQAMAAAEAATEEWKTLSTEVPQMVEAIQSRVDTLSQSKRLPKNVSKDAFEAAKTGLEATKMSWTEATTAFGAGDPVRAVELAKAARDSGSAALASLGMG